MNFDAETEATKKLYGFDQNETRPFGQQLLAARRFVERGVRFIQIMHGAGAAGAWDQHSNLKAKHSQLAMQVDRPVAGLLKDLKSRGLLDETLVVFATEFGRTPGSQSNNGRDHHPYGFSVWMAGGGIRGGIAHGTTDEIGFHTEEHPHYVTDIHATLLHQLGLESERMEIPAHKRLEMDFGHAYPGISSPSPARMKESRPNPLGLATRCCCGSVVLRPSPTSAATALAWRKRKSAPTRAGRLSNGP